MDEIINVTSTQTASTTNIQESITLATSSPVYQSYYDSAAFIWLSFLVVATSCFILIWLFFNKRMSR